MPASVFAAVSLVGVLAYMRWVLPRCRRRPAVIASAALVLLGGTLCVWLAPWCGLPALGLAFGHIGWALGRGRSPLADHRGSSAARTTTTPAVAAPSARIGVLHGPQQATLGRYRIDRELGRGSMGAVYLGHDPQAGRRVAIKTMALSREFAGAELADARARFFREAANARRLEHPDIVAVFDAGEADGLAFIAMEYVAGSDLHAHTLPGTLLPVATVLLALRRVALALAHAHRQGVVHRDIKPANVMFDAASGAVKVGDFGIASVANACRTRTGMVLGTPAFMSPEQMAGRKVDGRSDLYSLGVMLFQLLTGALPHRADSMAQLMGLIANAPAPDLRSLRPELPETLANVVALALEKRPETRYADGQQMADDLGDVIRLMQPDLGKGTGAGDAAAGSPRPEAAITAEPALGAGTSQSFNFRPSATTSGADPRHNSVL